jgi:hypothetical protein
MPQEEGLAKLNTRAAVPISELGHFLEPQIGIEFGLRTFG